MSAGTDDREIAAAGSEPWLPAFGGLLAIGMGYAWGMAWLSGCAVPWACDTAGRIDPERLAALTGSFLP